jgi:hypothetical protein
LIKIDKNQLSSIHISATTNMSMFRTLFRGADSAASEDVNIDTDMGEIEEELEDSKQYFANATNEVAQAAKESLSKRTVTQYERYYTHSQLLRMDLNCLKNY